MLSFYTNDTYFWRVLCYIKICGCNQIWLMGGSTDVIVGERRGRAVACSEINADRAGYAPVE